MNKNHTKGKNCQSNIITKEKTTSKGNAKSILFPGGIINSIVNSSVYDVYHVVHVDFSINQ